MALASRAPYIDNDSDEDKIMSAVSDFVDEPIMDHNSLDYRASSIRRIPSVKLFDDFASLEDLEPKTDRRERENELPSPLNKRT